VTILYYLKPSLWMPPSGPGESAWDEKDRAELERIKKIIKEEDDDFYLLMMLLGIDEVIDG